MGHPVQDAQNDNSKKIQPNTRKRIGKEDMGDRHGMSDGEKGRINQERKVM